MDDKIKKLNVLFFLHGSLKHCTEHFSQLIFKSALKFDIFSVVFYKVKICSRLLFYFVKDIYTTLKQLIFLYEK